MQWIEASVETKSEEIDAVCAQLAELAFQLPDRLIHLLFVL